MNEKTLKGLEEFAKRKGFLLTILEESAESNCYKDLRWLPGLTALIERKSFFASKTNPRGASSCQSGQT